ncbi:hypothetical protein A9Q86_01915 [Flavobacteriales bacterium 33_180_T64]|nr:hypothetical protein A9Q86_01915 [Flavobacteriales bacterium 33_180_T64]
MKRTFLVLILLFLSCKKVEASNTIIGSVVKIETSDTEVNSKEIKTKTSITKASLYKGTLNGTTKITLYINEQKHPCGGNRTIINAMYKYDNQKKWILLDVTTDLEKNNYCMVENGLTGVLLLGKHENTFSGNWISSNSKKQFKVELENQLLDIKFAKDHTIIEQLDDILFDELLYAKNDC